jgi:hypothetical protein
LTNGAQTDPQASGNESDIVYVTMPVTDFDAAPCDSLHSLGTTDTTSTGVKENKAMNSVSLYPNPATSSVNLVFNLTNAEKVNVKIYNVVGQELNVFEKELPSGSNSLTINLTNYKPGVYFIKSTTSGKEITKKLVIE